MKRNINKRTIWTAFLKPPTEAEILEAANTMKDGKAYLFRDDDGLMILRHRRRLNEFTAKREIFIKRIEVRA